jgi:hypothetical protein
MHGWRKWVASTLAVVMVGVWLSCLYGVIFGKEITAQVVSCSGFSTGRSCDVAWTYGTSHGVTSTDAVGAEPGGEMRVTYVPGLGVTNLDSQVLVIILLPAVVLMSWFTRAVRRRRERRTTTLSF